MPANVYTTTTNEQAARLNKLIARPVALKFPLRNDIARTWLGAQTIPSTIICTMYVDQKLSQYVVTTVCRKLSFALQTKVLHKKKCNHVLIEKPTKNNSHNAIHPRSLPQMCAIHFAIKNVTNGFGNIHVACSKYGTWVFSDPTSRVQPSPRPPYDASKMRNSN